MIKKMFLIILCIVSSASYAFATTQYYYLRSNGAGGNAGDTGTWNVVPSSDANAMTANNFNYTGNWSTTESKNKLDPDDVVYIKGSWVWENILETKGGITLDLYEPGDYAPNPESRNISPVFGGRIFIQSNDVTIQDGRFSGSPTAIFAIEQKKMERIKILRNYFNAATGANNAVIRLGFLCDSEFAHNYVEGIPQAQCTNQLYGGVRAQGFVMNAGSRNKIHHNTIDGGFTAFYFPGSRSWDDNLDTVDYPSSGKYTADPDINYQDNEISYNYIIRRCQEGITYDVSSEPKNCSIMERDTVASVNGTTITLDNSGGEWSGKGNLYSGYYMVAMPNRDNTFGNNSLIENHSGNTFTLSTPITNLSPGDQVVISMVFRHNWIHHNTFGVGGFNGSSILLSGVSLENLIEYNEFPQVNWDEGMGIHVLNLDGYAKAYGNVTQTYASGPSAYNIVRNNTCERLQNSVFNQSYGQPSGLFTRNNSFYNNTLLKNPNYDRYIYLNKANAYVSNSGPVSPSNGGGVRSSDPTGYVSAYFANWGLGNKTSLIPPNNVKVNIIVSPN